MAQPTNETQKDFKVNIAGDFAAGGALDIEPNEPLITRGEIRPNGNGGVQFEDEVPPEERRDARTANDRATTESLKSATGPSSLGQEAGKKLINPVGDWPVDE